MPGQLIRPSQWWMIDLQPNPIPPSPSSEIDHTLFPSCPSHLPPLMSEKSLSRVCAQPPPPHIHHRRHHHYTNFRRRLGGVWGSPPAPRYILHRIFARGAAAAAARDRCSFFKFSPHCSAGVVPPFSRLQDTTRHDSGHPVARAPISFFFPHGRPPACSSLVSLSAGETWTRPQWAMAMTPMPPPWPR